MAQLQDYSQMQVDILKATDNPAAHIGVALAIVMKQDACAEIKPVTQEICRNLWLAEHASVLEHVTYSFLIEGVSRSFLAQITRQRTASPTSGSQHYQDYSEYPMAINAKYADQLKAGIDRALETYITALETGVPREEARQSLPNSCTVNYLWTIDALNLFKFLRQRLCNRNVLEMRVFAERVLSLVQNHFPQLFNNAGPQCAHSWGRCYQHLFGMQCKEKQWNQGLPR